VDSFCRQFLTRFSLFSRIQRILTNLYYIDVLQIHTNPGVRIREYLQCSKDSFCGFVSYYGVQKICFVDSFRTTVFKRFVSWIRFVRPKISKDSICFVSEGFVYESRILRSYSNQPQSPSWHYFTLSRLSQKSLGFSFGFGLSHGLGMSWLSRPPCLTKNHPPGNLFFSSLKLKCFTYLFSWNLVNQ
jgi:hypothetical protein